MRRRLAFFFHGELGQGPGMRQAEVLLRHHAAARPGTVPSGWTDAGTSHAAAQLRGPVSDAEPGPPSGLFLPFCGMTKP